jgi:hypothetical protein
LHNSFAHTADAACACPLGSFFGGAFFSSGFSVAVSRIETGGCAGLRFSVLSATSFFSFSALASLVFDSALAAVDSALRAVFVTGAAGANSVPTELPPIFSPPTNSTL